MNIRKTLLVSSFFAIIFLGTFACSDSDNGDEGGDSSFMDKKVADLSAKERASYCAKLVGKTKEILPPELFCHYNVVSTAVLTGATEAECAELYALCATGQDQTAEYTCSEEPQDCRALVSEEHDCMIATFQELAVQAKKSTCNAMSAMEEWLAEFNAGTLPECEELIKACPELFN